MTVKSTNSEWLLRGLQIHATPTLSRSAGGDLRRGGYGTSTHLIKRLRPHNRRISLAEAEELLRSEGRIKKVE